MGKKTRKVASDLAALKAEVALLKKEVTQLRTEQDAKLRAELDNLHKRINSELEQAKQGAEREEKKTKGKVLSLEHRAARATGELKAGAEARTARIRKKAASLRPQKDYEEPEERPSVY